MKLKTYLFLSLRVEYRSGSPAWHGNDVTDLSLSEYIIDYQMPDRKLIVLSVREISIAEYEKLKPMFE